MDDLGGKPTIFGNTHVFLLFPGDLRQPRQCAQLGRDTGGFAQGPWLASCPKNHGNGGGKRIPGTLKLTASLHLKMDGSWKMFLSFWENSPIFRCFCC